MSYASLRDFIDALDKAGDLHRISAKVSPLLAITKIAGRVSKAPAANVSEHAAAFDPRHADLGGEALLFENVEGSSMPLLINALGSHRRMELALGCDREGGGFEALAA